MAEVELFNPEEGIVEFEFHDQVEAHDGYVVVDGVRHMGFQVNRVEV